MPKWSDIEPLCSARPGRARPDGRAVSDPELTLVIRAPWSAVERAADTRRGHKLTYCRWNSHPLVRQRLSIPEATVNRSPDRNSFLHEVAVAVESVCEEVGAKLA